jgi:type IX secretion system PorP/SprF family membrane protein
MTGVMNCSKRLSFNYRNQYASIMRDKAYNTFSAAYDQRIPVGRNDNFGVGVTFWGDRAGSLDFSQLQARASLSYAKRMGGSRTKANYLSVGADLGVTQKGYDIGRAQFGSQNNNGTFDPSLPTNETGIVNDYILYPDLSAGVLWFSVIDKFQNWYAGAAYSHINRANQSFTASDFHPMYSKFTFHAGGEFLTQPRFGLVPGIVAFKQGPQFQVNAGTSLKFLLGNNRTLQQALQFGVWTRVSNRLSDRVHADAVIFSTRFDYDQFNLGFSYDLNVSSASAATDGHGAFEFSMLYKICGNEKRRVYCPNF